VERKQATESHLATDCGADIRETDRNWRRRILERRKARAAHVDTAVYGGPIRGAHSASS
jgi:hypothetical protein